MGLIGIFLSYWQIRINSNHIIQSYGPIKIPLPARLIKILSSKQDITWLSKQDNIKPKVMVQTYSNPQISS